MPATALVSSVLSQMYHFPAMVYRRMLFVAESNTKDVHMLDR